MKSWKRFEQQSAALFGEERCWANSGEQIDFPRNVGHVVLGQCKRVRRYSVNGLVKLAGGIARMAGQNRLGVVCLKYSGDRSEPVVMMTFSEWNKLCAHQTLFGMILAQRSAMAAQTCRPCKRRTHDIAK